MSRKLPVLHKRLVLCIFIFSFIFSLFLFLFNTNGAEAAIDKTINIHGKLTNDDGTNISSLGCNGDGTCDFRFDVYDVSTGGSSLLSGKLTYSDIEVVDGIFSVKVDFTGNESVFEGAPRWIELEVDMGGDGFGGVGTDDMFGRVRMSAVPYAFNAMNLDGISGSGFVQIAPGTAQEDISTSAMVFLNKTGASGNILQLQDSGSDVFVIDNSGNVGIGMSTPAEALDVAGNVSNLLSADNTPVRLSSLTLASGDNNVWSMEIQGRYAYLVGGAEVSRMIVVDLSNPTSMTRVGAAVLDVGDSWLRALDVSGNYVYGILNPDVDVPSKFVVIDVSNPGNPQKSGSLTLGATELMGRSVVVSGNYAYVLFETTPAKVVAIDITDPLNPKKIDTIDLSTGENSGYELAIEGNYLYVGTYTSPARIVSINVSDPYNMTRIGSVTLNTGENNCGNIGISGRYLYASMHTSPTTIVTVDISNPVSPQRVGAVTLNSGENYGRTAFAGRYAYVTVETSPAKLITVDLSNPAAPQRLGYGELNAGESYGLAIAVSGRYALVSLPTSPYSVALFDIKGGEFSSLMAHSLEAGKLQVREDMKVYNRLDVGGGLNVGSSGIYTSGRLSVANDGILGGNLLLNSGYIEVLQSSTSPSTGDTNRGRIYAKEELIGGKLYYKDDEGTEYDLTYGSGSSLWLPGTASTIYPSNVGEYVAGTGSGLSISTTGNLMMNGSLTVEGEIIGRGSGDLIIRNTGTVAGHDLIIRTITNGEILLDSVSDVKFKDKSGLTIPLTVTDTAWNSYFIDNGKTGILDALNLLASGAEGGSEWTVNGTDPGVLHPLTTSRDFALGGDSSSAPFFFDTSVGSLYLGDDMSIGHRVNSDNDYLYFDAGGRWLAWDDLVDADIGISGTETRFEMNAGLGLGGALETTGNVIVGGGNLKVNPITTPVTCDSTNKGYIYYDSATDNLYVCDGTSWVDLTAGAGLASYWLLSGSNLYPDNASYDLIVGGTDSTAPFFFDTSAGELTIGGNMRIGNASATNDDYLYFDAGSEYLKWSNSNNRFDLSEELYLETGLLRFGGIATAPTSLEGRVYYNSADKNIYLYDGTDWRDLTAGADVGLLWQLSTDVLNPTSTAYDLAVGGSTSSAPLFFDSSLASLYIGDDLQLGRTSGTDNDYIYFDNSTTRWLAWDDASTTDLGLTGEDRFELSHGLGITGVIMTSSDATFGGNLVVSGGDFRLVPKAASSFTCDSSNNGRLYYDSDVETMYMCDGTSWVDILSGGGSSGDYWDRDDVNGFVYPSSYTDNLVLGSNAVATARLYMEVTGAQNKIVGDDSRNLDILARGGLYLRSYDTTGSGNIYSIAGGNISFQNAHIRAGSGSSTYVNLTNANFTGWNTNIPTGSRAIVDAINWLAGSAGGIWYDGGTNTWLGNMTEYSTDNVGIGTMFSSGYPVEKLTVGGGNLIVYNESTYSATEKVVNGNFTTNPDTAWTWGTNWSHDTTAGNAVHTPDNTTVTYLRQNISVVANQIYRVQFRVSSCTVGTVRVRLGNEYGESVCASNTVYTQVIRTTASANLMFYPTVDFNGRIDDVTVRLITGGNITANGNVTAGGNLSVAGTGTITGNLRVDGAITGGGSTVGIKISSAGNVAIGNIFPSGVPVERFVVSGGNSIFYNENTYSATEIVTNGTFATSNSWTWGTGWSHDGSALNAVHTPGSTDALAQDISAGLRSGSIYRIQYTVSSYVAGSIRVRTVSGYGLGAVYGEYVSANGTYTQILRVEGNVYIEFLPTSDFNGRIDTVSVRLVTGGDITVTRNVYLDGDIEMTNLTQPRISLENMTSTHGIEGLGTRDLSTLTFNANILAWHEGVVRLFGTTDNAFASSDLMLDSGAGDVDFFYVIKYWKKANGV